MIARIKKWAKVLKDQILMLWLAARDPRTPFAAKMLAGFVAAYAFSPIDLIPDFVPVLGLLDDLLLVPLGIWLSLRLIPGALRAELQLLVEQTPWPGPARAAAIGVVGVWLACAAGIAIFALR